MQSFKKNTLQTGALQIKMINDAKPFAGLDSYVPYCKKEGLMVLHNAVSLNYYPKMLYAMEVTWLFGQLLNYFSKF
jgi:hypothetical protein